MDQGKLPGIFSVEELAEQQNMSVSLFHQRFKSAVGMGPLQCQKRLRLTEARRLMLDEGRNVTEASIEVGYESLSQFIRDYRKMFGAALKEDVMRLRGAGQGVHRRRDPVRDKECGRRRGGGSLPHGATPESPWWPAAIRCL